MAHHYSVADYPANAKEVSAKHRKAQFVDTGEFRAPKKGEWFLSGAVPEVYCAPNDLSMKYHIMKEHIVVMVDLDDILKMIEDHRKLAMDIANSSDEVERNDPVHVKGWTGRAREMEEFAFELKMKFAQHLLDERAKQAIADGEL